MIPDWKQWSIVMLNEPLCGKLKVTEWRINQQGHIWSKIIVLCKSVLKDKHQ